ncbi:MAG TPA: metallophosphoesterase [Bacteroidia bacterium]|nr:metallophosphoesterase [Bacteroidia bacterium]
MGFRNIFPFILPFIITLIEYYFFTGVQTIIKDFTPQRKFTIQIVYWVISGITIFVFTFSLFWPIQDWPSFFRAYVVSILFVLFVSKLIGCVFLLIDDVMRIFRWGFQLVTTFNEPEKREGISRLKFMAYLSATFFTIPFVSLFYGAVRGVFRYKTHTVKLNFPNLPEAFNGLKIVQISDIHTGSFSDDTSHLSSAFDKAMELKPDIIFFTGDLINDNVRETDGFMHVYQKLKAPMGVYSILGNHDYGDYLEWPDLEAKKRNLEELKKVHAQAGWRLLLNEHLPLEIKGQKIALIGIENWGGNLHFTKYGKMDQAYKGTQGYDFKILLSHDPSHWNKQVKSEYGDVDLTLSGHTHGFQFGVEIPGFKWSPVQYVYPQWAGLYKHGKQFLYVNRGIGCVGREKVSIYKGRVGIWPEITLIELNKGAISS